MRPGGVEAVDGGADGDDEAPTGAVAGWDVGRFLVDDERALAAFDARASFSEFTAGGGGEIGRLAVVSFERADRLGQAIRDELGIGALTGPIALIGGGQAQWQSALWVEDSSPRQEIVQGLVEDALGWCRDEGISPIALFVRPADLPAFAAAFDRTAAPQPTDPWAVLEVPAGSSVESFVEGCRQRVRRNWRRDLRDRERLDLRVEVRDLDSEVVGAAGALVAHVSERNGLPEHPRVVAWRLGRLRERPGTHRIAVVSQGGTPVAYTFTTQVGPTYLAVHTVGVGDHPDRRSIYHQSYLAGLELGCELGVSYIGYGNTHLTPKLGRGCVLEPRWRFVV